MDRALLLPLQGGPEPNFEGPDMGIPHIGEMLPRLEYPHPLTDRPALLPAHRTRSQQQPAVDGGCMLSAKVWTQHNITTRGTAGSAVTHPAEMKRVLSNCITRGVV